MKIHIQYAGHSAIFLKQEKSTNNSIVLAIDPWLQGNPLCPPELQNPPQLDYIVLTHGHADHASDVPRLAKQSGAKVIATYELTNILAEEGVASEQLIGMNKGGSFESDGLHIKLLNAFHSSSFDSPTRGTLYAGEACSALIDMQGFRLFHAGDTCLFSDLQLIGEREAPDVACLPIGDRFTMGAKDAALAAKMLSVKQTIPIHYKTFPLLAQNANVFRSECEVYGIEVLEFRAGEQKEMSV